MQFNLVQFNVIQIDWIYFSEVNLEQIKMG